MADSGRRGGTLLLCLKFVFLAPICLVAWLLVLPWYTWVLAYASEFILKYAAHYPIAAVEVTGAGFLNTGTTLTYTMNEHRLTMQDVGHLVTNVAPFVALVLATSGLGVWRRLKILAAGVGIIFVFHAATIVLRYAGGRTTLPTAIGFIAITLPFLLWIVLAYWDAVIAYFGGDDENGAEEAPRKSPGG